MHSIAINNKTCYNAGNIGHRLTVKEENITLQKVRKNYCAVIIDGVFTRHEDFIEGVSPRDSYNIAEYSGAQLFLSVK